MSPKEEIFDLVFSGTLVKGVELATAKKNMAQLFKINDQKVESLFSGKPVVLKRGLSLDVANKYRVTIKKAGAIVELREQASAASKPSGKARFGISSEEPKSPTVNSAPAAAPDAAGMGSIPGTEDSAVGAIPGTATPAPYANASDLPSPPSPSVEVEDEDSVAARSRTAALGNRESAPSDQEAVEGLSLAPAGSDLLLPEESHLPGTVEVDVSGISLKGMGGNLLEDSEYALGQNPDIELPDLELAQAGADVLRPEERSVVEPVAVDVSGIDLDDSGGNLAPPKPAAPPPPDTSNLSLKDT